jgi:hypothetical protein
MASSPKHANRVVVYFTDEQYVNLLKSAAKFDKTPGEYMRFEMLRSMHGSLGLAAAYGNNKRSAFECEEEGEE